MANFIVTTLNDEAFGGGETVATPDGTGLSLREALGLALANGAATTDTITFDANLTGGSNSGVDDGHLVLANSELVIDSDVTIDGDTDGDDKADVTIDANSASRVLHVTGGTSTLVSLTMTGGRVAGAADDGGGILIAGGANLTIVNSTVSGSYAGRNGGGIANLGDVTLINSTLSGNTANRYGGGLHSGDISATAETATLINTTVAGNAAYGGGGININSGSILTLSSSTVSGNSADPTSGYGGGLYNGGTATLTNSIVVGNDAATDAEISELAAVTYTGVNVVGVGTDTDDTDGVIETPTLDDLFDAVAANPSTGVVSGVLADNGGPVQTIAILQTGVAYDGGDTAELPPDTLDLDGDTLDTEPLPFDARGEARVDGASVDIGAFEIQAATPEPGSLNVTTELDVVDAFDGLTSLREALAYANSLAGADTVTFDAVLAGLTITLAGSELIIASDVTIDGDIDSDGNADITVSGNDASTVFNVNGGAAPAITASLNGLVIRDGFEPILGGAGIRVVAGDVLIVTNATITENVSTGGGGILNYGSATLINTILSGNDAGVGTGGGILNEGTLDIIGSTLSGNQAGYNGGAIFNYLGAVTLTNSTISGNFTGLLGGGIANRLGSVELTNTTVVGNEADFGGGIFNASALTLTNSTVTGNYASGVLTYSGGGIAHGGSGSYTTLINSIVAGNAAAVGDGDLANTTIPTLTGGNIVGGTRTIDGGTQQTGILLDDIFASVTVNPDTLVLSGTLGSNGGPVQTVALEASAANPALDAGDDGLAPATDARGFSRDDVAGAANNGTNFSDLGAFEASHSLVVTTADDVVDATDGLLSLREALALAASNPGADTITFDASLDIVEVDGSALVIADDVTIDGDTDGDGDGDIEIDAFDLLGGWRVFDVIGGTSTLQHLVVTGGDAAGDGGGIRVAAGASLTLADVAVIGNDADGDGGGIWNEGTLTLTNAFVAGNEADGGGGGIWNDGTLTLTDTLVAHNYAAGGGGIANHEGSTATLINTTLLGNYVDDAAGLGGGILSYAGAALTLVNSTLYGNSA